MLLYSSENSETNHFAFGYHAVVNSIGFGHLGSSLKSKLSEHCRHPVQCCPTYHIHNTGVSTRAVFHDNEHAYGEVNLEGELCTMIGLCSSASVNFIVDTGFNFS